MWKWGLRALGIFASAILFHVVWPISDKLGEAAVSEWANQQFAERLGIGDPTTEQVVDFCVSWAAPILLVALFAAVWWAGRWFERRRSTGVPAPTSMQVPSSRISMLDLLAEARQRGWVFKGDRDDLARFELALRQAAADFAVTLWGIDLKKNMDFLSAPNIYVKVKIDPKYFTNHWIDLHQSIMFGNNAYAGTGSPSSLSKEDCYSDLHADRQEAMRWLSGDAEVVREKIKSPLEIVFDPSNPAKRFWRRIQARDKDGKEVAITICEYRVGVRNISGKTVKNVRVQIESMGEFPIDPKDLGFQKDGSMERNIDPNHMELVPVWWQWPPQAGDAWGPTATAFHGPIRIIARGNDVQPAAADFDYFSEQTPVLVRKSEEIL